MSVYDLLSLLPVIMILGWAVLILLVDRIVPHGWKAITATLTAAGLISTLLVVLFDFNTLREGFMGQVQGDSFAALLQAIVLLVGLIAVAQAFRYLQAHEIERGEYYSLLLFSVGGMMLMTTAGDLVMIFLSLELFSIPLYVLSGIARPRTDSEEAALKYFLLGAFATGFLVYGIALVFGAAQTTDLQLLTERAIQLQDSKLLLTGLLLILVGLSFKVGAVPFHMWTPDVYQGAPTAVTSFMAVGAKVGGFAALLRVFIMGLPALAGLWGPAVMAIAAITMVWGNVAAISQRNLKRMLAYSSIAHGGYMLMALPAAISPAATPNIAPAVVFYLAAYAVTNLGAWGVIMALETKLGENIDLENLSGLGRKNPVLALAMAVFMISLTGLPPTVGFMGKFYLFRVVMQADLVWLALVGVITSLISAYYYLRVIVMMYMREGTPELRLDGWLKAAIWISGGLVLLLGIAPGFLLNAADIVQFIP